MDALGANSDPNKCSITMGDLLGGQKTSADAGKENYEHKANTEPDRTVVVLNGNGRLGSVYKQVHKTLARQGGWKRKKNTTARFHMVLGEAHGAGIPYKRFSQTFRYDYGICPLVNYYRCAKAITDKVMMVQTIKQYAGESKDDVSFLPESYLFWPGKADVSQTSQFEDAFDSGEGANVWIVKPAGASHGDRIFLSKSKSEILDHIADQREGSSPWLVQRYCENPQLLDGGRKFDMRVWVVVNHNFDIFLYDEGSCRTSCEPFSVGDLRNKFVHITNHSVQMEHPKFGQFEKGAEMFFPELARFLRSNTDFRMDEDVLPQIKHIVKTTLLSAKSTMESIDGVDDYKSFMLFGFDLILDSNGQVWLLEVNGAPAVAQSLLPKLAEDLIETAIDPLFPRDYSKNRGEGKSGSNGFEMIYKSTGKCAIVQSMPAPTTGMEIADNEIEAFGGDGADEGKRSTRK